MVVSLSLRSFITKLMECCSCKRRVKEHVRGWFGGLFHQSKEGGDCDVGGSKFSSSEYTFVFKEDLSKTKCLMRDTFNNLILLLEHLILTLVSMVSIIVAWPSHLGANFFILPKILCSEKRTKSPILKLWAVAFLSSWNF